MKWLGFGQGFAELKAGEGMSTERTHEESALRCSKIDVLRDDQGLVLKAKSGDSSAFGALYERHRSRVYRCAFQVLRNREDAEDAVQRCFQRALTKLPGFREASAFSTWVTRIAINEALMLRRQRRAVTTLPANNDDTETQAGFSLTASGPTPEQSLAENELRGILTQAVYHLRKKRRMAVLLRELHGFSTEETARRLGLSAAGVKARVFHARRDLLRYLGGKMRIGCRDLPR
jgi:RNA polymerase sigma-70 factor, ECF subfamily